MSDRQFSRLETNYGLRSSRWGLEMATFSTKISVLHLIFNAYKDASRSYHLRLSSTGTFVQRKSSAGYYLYAKVDVSLPLTTTKIFKHILYSQIPNLCGSLSSQQTIDRTNRSHLLNRPPGPVLSKLLWCYILAQVFQIVCSYYCYFFLIFIFVGERMQFLKNYVRQSHYCQL